MIRARFEIVQPLPFAFLLISFTHEIFLPLIKCVESIAKTSTIMNEYINSVL